MSFIGMKLTESASAISDDNPLKFTHVQLGDGTCDGSFSKKEALSQKVMQIPVKSVKRNAGEVVINCDFNSKEAPQGFYFREVGIVGNGVLCYYDNSGDDAEYIDPDSEAVVKQKRFRFVLKINEEISVQVNVASGLYALKEELDANVQELEEELDGKVAKWFADLKTVAFTGKYTDLTDKPTIPSKTSQLTNDSGFKTTDTVYTHPISAGNKHIPAGGASGQILRWSADGTAAWGSDNNTNTWRGIQNNLTSDSTTDSLSAAQGKALKTLVDEKAALSHTHSYLPLSGGTITGDLKANGKITSGTSSAPGEKATAFGEACYAPGNVAFAAGGESYAMGIGTVAIGCGCAGRGNYGVALGYNTEASYFQFVYGSCNKSSNGPSSQGAKSGDAFIIGNGTSGANRSNAFRVTGAGQTYACAAYTTSGCDYAEYFEWEDRNEDKEDRRGYFVTLSGDKIKLAEPGNYILGVVSAHPSVIGNGDECWNGRYLTDDLGAYIEETYEYDEISVDENGEETTTRKTGVTWKQNPDYDPEMTYIQRADRTEWDAVGMIGVLPVRDDRSCEVNGYCTVAEGGIATACSRSASPDVYRVIARSGENVVKIVVK